MHIFLEFWATDRGGAGTFISARAHAIALRRFSRLGSRIDADDVAQEVLLRAVANDAERLRRADPDTPLDAWLTIATMRVGLGTARACWSRRRKSFPVERESLGPRHSVAEGSAGAVILTEERGRLLTALGRLPEGMREVMHLRIAGLDHTAIGRLLDRDRATVGRLAASACLALRRLLGVPDGNAIPDRGGGAPDRFARAVMRCTSRGMPCPLWPFPRARRPSLAALLGRRAMVALHVRQGAPRRR